MKKIAVLVPCYNEELTIKAVVEDFKKVIPQADIYVYDNNSKDNTAQIAKEAGAIVVPEYRQGKGNVVRSMFRDIEADCYIMVDGDDTYPAEDAYRVAKVVLEGKADMAIGDRLSSTYFEENKRPFHNLGNKLVRMLINKIFKSNIKDIMTGCRAFNRTFVKSFPVLSKGFEIETEMSIHALDKKFLIGEVPIAYRDRPEGSESKLNTFADGFKVLKTILNLYKDYKPLSFFGIISLILLLLSGGMFAPILIGFFKTGLVPKFPTLIVAVGFLVCALVSFACGLILDTVKKRSDQFYEIALNMIESNKNR
ncbi:glycosyltransferase [Romboutsia maritimum]|uniref:Glycosyltransferase n=1 Tax=Romboutsia maritimum TaxID=2020948 RepID=A0A371IS24_9FIRM|nr:glycosyltransferase family 2 protein [Romboutsia maritimum]RDY23286.1 glycosyltransferase [Romboutsia maritimum]